MRIFGITVLGWEYRMGLDLDLVNLHTFPNYVGVAKINDVASQGWEPILLCRSDAIGFKTAILFRRRKWFPRKTTGKDWDTPARADQFASAVK